MGPERQSRPPFIHLYESQGLLIEEEETDNRAAQELTRYQITPDPKPESAHESESEVRIIIAHVPTVQQPAVVLANRVKQGKRLKHTYRAPVGSPLVRSRGEGSRPQPKRLQLEHLQPEPQPEPSRLENPEEEEERP